MNNAEVKKLLIELGIETEHWHGVHKGRQVRFSEVSGSLDVGEGDRDFDRWANSLAFSFDLREKKGVRAFLRWAKDK